MDNLSKCKIPLRDISKDISFQLNNGKKNVLILSPNEDYAVMLLKELKKEERAKCRIKIYTQEEYFLHIRKNNPKIYEIDLYQIELT